MIYLIPLAVFGITYIMRYTDGPLDLFKRIRILVGFIYRIDGDEEIELVDNNKFLCKLYSCVPCLSTWISFFVVAMYTLYFKYSFVDWVIISFASVGFTIYMDNKVV